jgi:predicted Rossmann fold nucleotide-binding protein DprA/Smf involved in DNA uptake
VYVVPANLDVESAAGTNALLCSGLAMPVMCAADILLPFQASYPQLHLRPRAGSVLQPKESRKGEAKAEEPEAPEEKKVDTGAPDQYIDLQTDAAPLTEEEQSLLTALAEGEKTAEELSALCQLSGAQTLSTLTLLTLRGAVEELGGGRFRALVRIKEEQQE